MSAVSACPACAAAPLAEEIAGPRGEAEARIVLSLPKIHCAGCIAGVERGLMALPEVTSARVNLTLRRATIEAEAGVEASTLVERLAGLGYEAHELDAGTLSQTAGDLAGRELLMRLAVAGFAMMNVMLLSVAVWSGATDATRDLFHWVSAMIALPTIAFSGQPFFRSAATALAARRLNMDVPISLAILLAGGMSLYETMMHGEQAYFDAALSLTFFLLAGRYLDHRTRAIARSAAEELAALEVPRAQLLDGTVVAISQLAIGDLVVVKPGGRMPVDGVITQGTSELDRSLLTGETLPVFAVAESSRNRYTSLADRAAQIYAPGVHLLALLAFLGWLAGTGGDVRFALNIAVAVLIITCPCALGLAVPAVTTAASGRLFRKGLLIKDGTALERLAEVTDVVFDKTGTLTQGTPELTNLARHSRRDLEVALALAEASSHPLARALAQAARVAGIRAAELSDLAEVPGYGVEAIWRDRPVRLGRATWVGAEAGETTAAYLKIGESGAIAFTFADRLRDGAAEAVSGLLRQGKRVHLVSGDAKAPVADLAARLGIDDWTAEALPADKVARIEELMAQGAKVLMVGDGLNDTAALARAHVSISPASALDAARVASDIVMLGSDLSVLTDAALTARHATRRIIENFGIAAVYNLIAVPIALAGFATPLAAALAMSGSSIMVSLNALRLR